MPEKVTDVPSPEMSPEQQMRIVLNNRIEHNFRYHPPVGDQPKVYSHLREEAKLFALEIGKYVPNSRELSLALTKLEECVMWANAGIARNGGATEAGDLP